MQFLSTNDRFWSAQAVPEPSIVAWGELNGTKTRDNSRQSFLPGEDNSAPVDSHATIGEAVHGVPRGPCTKPIVCIRTPFESALA